MRRLAAAAPIQRAMYAVAVADQTLSDLVGGRVFDEVPEKPALPFVVLGDAEETPSNTHDCFGSSTVVTFHVWSDYRGTLEGNTIAGRLIELFDHQPLTVDGHTVIVVRHKANQPMRDSDPRIRHVPVRMQVVTEQES